MSSNTLRNPMTDSQDSIPLLHTIDFPNLGIVKIENEYIKYSHSSDTDLLQCIRGYFGSTPATHAKGLAVLFYTDVPTNVELNSTLNLASPASLTADNINSADILFVSSIISDTLTLTVPNPSNVTPGRILTISHTASSAGTLSINTKTIAPGESIELTWDGTNWMLPHDETGGGGITYPLLSPTSSTPQFSFTDSPTSGLRWDSDGMHLSEPINGILTLDGSSGSFEILLGGGGNSNISLGGNSFPSTAVSVGSVHTEIDWNDTEHSIDLRTDNQIIASFDHSTTSGDTRMLIWDVDAGALHRVTVGAADSGGVGFKVLRIPN